MSGKTIIVTAGYGHHHTAWACHLVDHVNRLADGVAGAVNAIRAVNLTSKISADELSYPPMAKLYVWRAVPADVMRIIWLDTDVYVRRAILEDDLPWNPFSAVQDPWVRNGAGVVHTDRDMIRGLPRYFNSGFYCATRDAVPAFDLAIAEQDHRFAANRNWTHEQDLFNWAVWKEFAGCSPTSPGWTEAGERWNMLPKKRVDTAIDPVVVHMALCGERDKVRFLRDLYAGKEPVEILPWVIPITR